MKKTFSTIITGSLAMVLRLVLITWIIMLGWPSAGQAGAQSARSVAPADSRVFYMKLGPLPKKSMPARPRPPKKGEIRLMPEQVGTGRDIEQLRTPEGMRQYLVWQPQPDGGKMAAMHITSVGAMGVRLGLYVKTVPDAAEFRFSGSDGKPAHVVTGETINRVIARNLAAGDAEPEARYFWSPLFGGEYIHLSIYLPPSVAPEQLDMEIPVLSHLFVPLSGLVAPQIGPLPVGNSGACNQDVSCEPAWIVQKSAVGMIFFNAGANLLQCSGTLLNDRSVSRTPFLFTANHCIDNQTKASSVETLWFYHSTACDSGALNPEFQNLLEGAEMLQVHVETDSTLLRLLQAAPAGVTFAGWDVEIPALAQSAVGLHHPRTDLQKICLGSSQAFLSCTLTPEILTCQNADSQTGTFVNVSNTVGTVEPGSSGSGLFKAGGELIGTLSGSSSSCANPGGNNIYGRFDRAFLGAELWRWLDPLELFRQGGEFTRVATFATGVAQPPPPAPAAAAGGGGGGGCFIATAAHGSAGAPQVVVLRQFRDRVLLRSDFGRRLTGFYYHYSPPIAKWLADRPLARAVVRVALVPVVETARLTMKLMDKMSGSDEPRTLASWSFCAL